MPVVLVSVLECKAAAKDRVESLCKQHGIVVPKVTFNLTGTDAGCAYIEHHWIDLNLMLFRENFDEFVSQVIPHELVHNWHERLKLGGSAHGREWKGLMRRMGAAPIPCHNMNTDASASTTGYFAYRCICNSGNMVSFEKHRQMQEYPEDYFCGRCEQQFVYVG